MKQVKDAVRLIEENDWVEVLRKCATLKERYDKLMELLPETWLWGPITARQLVFYLHRKHSLDFGVCPFYEIEMEKNKQYCSVDGQKVECLCVIPQPYCVFRDKDGTPPQNIQNYWVSIKKSVT